jgi:hypothetical protein
MRGDDLRRHGWVSPQTLHIPDWCGCATEYLPVLERAAAGGVWSRSGNRMSRRIRCGVGSRPSPTGRVIRDSSRPALYASLTDPMPLKRQPGPPRVVVNGIEGHGFLYAVELPTVPSLEWLVPPSFLRPWSARGSRSTLLDIHCHYE